MPVITEAEYRKFSNDYANSWSGSAESIGVSDCVDAAEADIAEHLSTFLEPSRTDDEFHRLMPRPVYRMGVVLTYQTRCHLNHMRLLWGDAYPIVVEQVHQGDCSATNAGKTTGATVVKPLSSLVDVDACLTACPCWYDKNVAIEVRYWSGFETLPEHLKRTIVMWAQRYVLELITWHGAPDPDWPVEAPVTAVTHLSTRRAFQGPRESAFGASHLGMVIEDRLERYVVPLVRSA